MNNLDKAVELLKQVSNFIFDLDIEYNKDGNRDYLSILGYTTLENDIDEFLNNIGEFNYIK